MSLASDDLSTVLLAPDREFAGYGQAVLLGFNAETFENEVDYRGAILTNLPVMSGTEALTYQAGDVVLLMKWRPAGRKGLGSYWIAGRPVIPGSGRAEEAIAFLTSNLAAAISKQVFANSIFANTVGLIEGTTSSSYTDLATVGPTVADVEIAETGKALVFTSSRIILNAINNPFTTGDGLASFQVTGATSISPIDANALFRSINFATHDGGNPHIINESGTYSKMTLLENLNPGLHTFRMKYMTGQGGLGYEARFGTRTIIVIAF